MATVGDYVVLSGGMVTLRAATGGGGGLGVSLIRYDFSLPSNASVASSSVLAWRFEADDNPKGLSWKFDINGIEVASFSHNSDRFCSLHEVVGGNILHVGHNQATATVLSGQGQIKVSDVVLHFQANM